MPLSTERVKNGDRQVNEHLLNQWSGNAWYDLLSEAKREALFASPLPAVLDYIRNIYIGPDEVSSTPPSPS
jgi:hypothetical protein